MNSGHFSLPAALIGGLLVFGPLASGQSDEPPPADEAPPAVDSSAVDRASAEQGGEANSYVEEIPLVDLFEGLRSGRVGLKAEGAKGGAMTLSVTNNTRAPLRVVLPPGLIASGAAGQFGGMGGMGGGMGGMGGGGMGGMGGGGMGGMGGGGMGGGGMGGGGMGGGMGGRGGGGVMPASRGMMMLGMLIMQLIETDSWDVSSLMMGGMGMMGGGMGGGMGGMGGGMGGMGGGMGGMGGGMGGMGGGFMSIPPTGPPSAALAPGQTRNLRTRAISLSPPVAGRAVLPAEGEALQIGDIGQAEAGRDPVVREAFRRLAEEKAPESVAQLVMWKLIYELDWATIRQLSRRWANPHELTLARQFVRRIKGGAIEPGSDGRAPLYIEMDGDDPIAESLCRAISGATMLGMKVGLKAPNQPDETAVACMIRFNEAPAGAPDREATVMVYASDAEARSWTPMGKFSLPIADDAEAQGLAVELATGILGRLVHAQVGEGKLVKGEKVYKLRVDNASPLLLNGLALAGPDLVPEVVPSVLAGFSLAPRHSMSFTITREAVDRLHLESGVQVMAADFHEL
ncbi:hypothetical protein [Tautonia plasticadhaerens]|uniref:Uncharacterized protein n=1 Tax=Tautonia plasticadhaerens TaxID=2527974 RepID=A0A518GVQ1_9BACT|nr:hypothetical protein [Tautonia plasticadhaerens]QDV32638.1 hypothetical protein ElP_04730 [Tautonia plasticadhaerens]